MIVEKGQPQLASQQQRHHLQATRHILLAASGGVGGRLQTRRGNMGDEMDADGEENDEENIVIDLADEDDDDDDDDDEAAAAKDDDDVTNSANTIHHNSNHDTSAGATIKSRLAAEEEAEQHFNGAIYATSSSNNNHFDQEPSEGKQKQSSRSKQQQQQEAEWLRFQPGDLVWFDPSQLGYSIPGKVLDSYPDLPMITVEGHALPSQANHHQSSSLTSTSSNNHNNIDNSAPTVATNANDESAARAVLASEQELQVYNLGEQQQLASLRERLPLVDERGVADLTDLAELSLESIVWDLKLRHQRELIYTRCGHKILLSVNPLKQLCSLYNLDQVSRYDAIDSGRLRALAKCCPSNSPAHAHCASSLIRWLLLQDCPSKQQPSDLQVRAVSEPATTAAGGSEPHIFGLANEALKRLLVGGQDQCFVLLGESGSGKTEAYKLLVQYLASVNKSPTNLMTEQILESIQLLESFGNARTTHNDNSSRFGKLLEIRFELATGFIASAHTHDLNLLDRTRIVCQPEGERNYHVFYELLAGLSRGEKEKYGLQSAEKYFYLNQGHCNELGAKDDADDFRALLSSMQVLGFNYEEQDTIFRLLASVLHLGNVYFHRKVLAVRSGRLAEQQHNQQAGGGAGVEGVEIGSDTELRWLSHLLQVQFESVLRCLTVRTTETGSGVNVDRVITPLTIDQALDTRDAMARTLYTCLFKWLVQRINAMINAGATSRKSTTNQNQQHEDAALYMCRASGESSCEFQPNLLSGSGNNHQSRQSSLSRASLNRRLAATNNGSSDCGADDHNYYLLAQAQAATVSILDSFGFENLEENNFEQLCINYAAELLQYHTIRYLVRLEQAEYARERLRWDPIQFNSSSGSTNANNASNYGGTNGSTTSIGGGGGGGGAALINLLSKKPLGILALLDDECNFPKATDQSFVEKCHHNHTRNENYQRARLAANCQEFGVRHFRQPMRLVWYQVDGFIEKNRDSLRPDVAELLLGSRMTIVGDMLRKLHHKGDHSFGSSSTTRTLSRTFDGRYVSMKPRATTVAAKFQDALNNNRVLEAINCPATTTTTAPAAQLSLESSHYACIGRAGSEALHAAGGSSSSTAAAATSICASLVQTQATSGCRPNPWFVICLKPNKWQRAGVFDVGYVQEQARCFNLLELTQVRARGYPIRLRYGEFVRRYKCLVPQKFLNSLTSCQDIQAANARAHQQQQREPTGLKSSGEIKRAVRDVCSAIVEFRFLQQSQDALQVVRLQYQCGLTKMFLNERLYYELERLRLIEHQRAVRLLQRTLRMWLVRRDFLIQRKAVIVLQSQVRAYLARREFWRQYIAIVCLQRRWRQLLASNRRKQAEARRRARRQQQQQGQLVQLQAQQRAQQANLLRHRLQPAQLAALPRVSGAGLDVPVKLAQLYRLQRDWPPVHDLTHLVELNLFELEQRELKRRSFHGNELSSIPFIALPSLAQQQSNIKGKPPLLKSDQQSVLLSNCWRQSRSSMISSDTMLKAEDHIESSSLVHNLEQDEHYSLENFLALYFTDDVPQFGYSRLPITRPFSWRLIKRRLKRKRASKERNSNQENDEPTQPNKANSIRLAVVEQKALALYKLILRYVDSELELPAAGTEGNNDAGLQQHHEQATLQRVLKFKLLADYVIYLCLKEPLLRDELYLQLASLSWQNPRPKSAENVWHLMVNCLSCFAPNDFELAKFLVRHASDHCSDKYRELTLERLANWLSPRIAGEQHRAPTNSAQSKQQQQQARSIESSRTRSRPPCLLEYWANRRAIARLAISASCYMDELAPASTVAQEHEAINDAVERRESSEGRKTANPCSAASTATSLIEQAAITNYACRTLIPVGPQTSAEELGAALLGARDLPSANLFGWSVEIEHEGALSEFSCRLRGDDLLFDQLTRVELLPEFTTLIESTDSNDSELWLQQEPQTPQKMSSHAHRTINNNNSSMNDANLSRYGRTSAAASSSSRGGRKQSATEFTAPPLPSATDNRRLSMISQRSSSEFSCSARRRSSCATSSEMDLSQATSRLSSSSIRRQSRDQLQQKAPEYWSTSRRPMAAQQMQQQQHYYQQQQQQQLSRYAHHQREGAVGPQQQVISPDSLSAMQGQLRRRSMSMQELQLASTALNGRYFIHQLHHQPLSQQHQTAASNQVAASGYEAAGSISYRQHQAQQLRRSRGQHGSLQQLNHHHHHQQQQQQQQHQASTNNRLRSQTPNSMMTTNRMSSSAYGSESYHSSYLASTSDVAGGTVASDRHGRQLERGSQLSCGSLTRDCGQLPRGARARRSASSSRTGAYRPTLGVGGPGSDYASAHSDYERLKLPAPAPGNYHAPRNLPAGQAKHQATQQEQRYERLPASKPPGQQQQASRSQQLRRGLQVAMAPQLVNHYAGSSAMSDTSEAPSLASHVRAVRVPHHNGDLDQYLDDLFNPMLAEAELDELSDARSLATSIRGTIGADEEESSTETTGFHSTEAGGTQTEAQRESDGGEPRASTLSPTFESLLESLQKPHQQSSVETVDSIVETSQPPPMLSHLGGMNLSELKALNEKLEHQIQAAQSSRASIEQLGSNTGRIPAPPPQPAFDDDDPYSRAKTVRIGKWRWPPPREDCLQAPEPSLVDSLNQQQQRTSDLDRMAMRMREVAPVGAGCERDLPQPPPPLSPEAGQTAVASSQENPNSTTSAAAGGAGPGRLKISSEMKAKLEQLTNISSAGNSSSAQPAAPATTAAQTAGLVSQAKSLLLAGTADAESKQNVKRLADQRRALLEVQLLGKSSSSAEGASNSDGQQQLSPEPHQQQVAAAANGGDQSTAATGSKVLAAKQQLAAAAGLELAALDAGNGSQASSRRQSGAILSPTSDAQQQQQQQQAYADPLESGQQSTATSANRAACERGLSSRATQNDELGPQSRSAVSQRQAFYQLSASSDQLTATAGSPNQAQAQQQAAMGNHQRQASTQLPSAAVSSDDLQLEPQMPRADRAATAGSSLTTNQSPLTRSVPMAANLNEIGRSGKSTLSERQHESLLGANRVSNQAEDVASDGEQWIASSPDPTLESRRGGLHSKRASEQHLQQLHEQAQGKRRANNSASPVGNKQQLKNQQINQQPQQQQQREEQGAVICLAYANVDWHVRVRKELFLPSETYDDPLVTQLIFAQLVADAFNPHHWTRLNNKERAAIKSLMKDNGIGYTPSLPPIGQLQGVKRDLVRMARSFGLYFTRAYSATNFALSETVASMTAHHDSKRRRRRASATSSSSARNSARESSSSSLDNCSEEEEEEEDEDGNEQLEDFDRSVGDFSNSFDDDDEPNKQSLRLLERLRKAGDLGTEWLDMVAVHHSGLRLVSLVGEQQRQQQQNGPPLGCKVLETLKYRDMTGVSQVSSSEILVSMCNGRKCWLLRSSQADQLSALLRRFHADYNDHLVGQQQQQQQQPLTGPKLDPAEQKQQRAARAQKVHQPAASAPTRRRADRVAAADGGSSQHSGDAEHQVAREKHQQQQINQQEKPLVDSKQKTRAAGESRLDNADEDKTSEPQASTVAASVAAGLPSNASRNGRNRKNLWQNSLSRMSNKFSIFGAGGSQSRNSTDGKRLSTTSYDEQQANDKLAGQLEEPQLTLDGWIETKVDFDEDDECEADLEASSESALEAKQQQPLNLTADSVGHQQQSIASDGSQSIATQEGAIRSRRSSTTIKNNNNNNQQQQQQDDGKHSLLQFALYNFREAVDKYSLESQQEAGDTSTLRGSLKLLESLRSGVAGSRGSAANKASRASRGNRRTSGLSAAGSTNGGNNAPVAPGLQADWTWRELAEMVKWTKTPIKQSLLKLPSDELSRRAADCFLAVMQYMGDWQGPTPPTPAKHQQQKQQQQQQQQVAAEPAAEVECVYLILSHCHNWPELRDELYCQLMKQTTSNRSESPDSCLRGWRLFSILAAYFDCSESFRPYLLNYLETAAYDKRRAYYSVASLCLQNLRKTLRYGGRKNVPSIEEIAATSAGRNSKRQIYRLPGGTERVINTKSTTVVDDIIREICANMLGVSEPDEMLEFSLYCIADGDLYTMPLSRDDYILDVTTELVKNHQQYFLIFCRSIWHHPLRLDSRLYIEVIFNQVAPDYLEGLLMVFPGFHGGNSGSPSGAGSLSSNSNGGGRLAVDQQQQRQYHQQQQQPLRLRTKLVKEVARIAALLHRASGTDYMPRKDEIRYLLPRPLVAAMKLGSRSAASCSSHYATSGGAGEGNSSSGNDSTNPGSLERNNNISPSELETVITSPQKWVELVQDNWREMSAFDTLDAKAQFLEIVRHWPLFGSSFFAIKLIQRDLIQPADYILALNKLGIQMLEPASHETIHLYPLNEVVSTRKVRSEDGALFLDLKCGNLMKRTIIRIQTDQAHEISRLIRQYIDIELLQQRQRQQVTPIGSKTTLISTIQQQQPVYPSVAIEKTSMTAVTTPSGIN